MKEELVSLASDLGFERKKFVQAIHGLQKEITNKLSNTRIRSELMPIIKHLETLIHSSERINTISNTLEIEMIRENLVSLDSYIKNIRDKAKRISEQYNKKIQFVIQENKSECDDGILKMFEPVLIEMLHPMIEYGIESEKERKARGKKETSFIEISTKSVSGGVQIRILMDGNGILPPHIEKFNSTLSEIGIRAKFDGKPGQWSVFTFSIPKHSGPIKILPIQINGAFYCIPGFSVVDIKNHKMIMVSYGFDSINLSVNDILDPFEAYLKKLPQELNAGNKYIGLVLHSVKNEDILSLVLNPAAVQKLNERLK